MRRWALILGNLLLAAAFALPVYAMGGGGMGGGGMGGMMRNGDAGLQDWFQRGRDGGGYTNPGSLDRRQREDLDLQHQEDSVYLQYQIRMKERELDALLSSAAPDIEKARTLRRGLRALREEADQEQRNYELEASRMNPGYPSGNRNGWTSGGGMGNGGSGMGYGGRMGYSGSGR